MGLFKIGGFSVVYVPFLYRVLLKNATKNERFRTARPLPVVFDFWHDFSISFMYGMFQNYCIFARSKSQHHGTQENKESTGEKYDQTEKEIQVHYWLQGTR